MHGSRRISSGLQHSITPPSARHMLDALVGDIAHGDFAGDLADHEAVGRDFAADHGRPRPQEPSMVITERSPVSGLRVNITPAVRASPFCTTTAMATPLSGKAVFAAIRNR